MRTLTRWCPVLLIAVVATGCAAATVRARHAAEYGCAESAVTVVELPGSAYLARGCGTEVSYVCITGGWGQSTCAANVGHGGAWGASGSTGGTGTSRVSVPPPREASAARRAEIAANLASAGDAVLACFPGVARIDLRLLVAPEGNVYHVRAARTLVSGERNCVMQAFSGRNAPPADAAVSVQVRFPDEALTASTDTPQANGAPPPVAATAPADDGTRLRTWLDGQRDATLACTQRTTVVLTARWDASGAVTIALVGDLAGTAAEGCVQTALGAQHVAAGTAGELRHLVR